jgi:hypothetical protein
MRPPINLPWGSIASQVRFSMFRRWIESRHPPLTQLG